MFSFSSCLQLKDQMVFSDFDLDDSPYKKENKTRQVQWALVAASLG